MFNVAQCDFRHSKIDTQGRYTVRIDTQAERDEIIKDMNQRLINLETNQTAASSDVGQACEDKVTYCCSVLRLLNSSAIVNSSLLIDASRSREDPRCTQSGWREDPRCIATSAGVNH